MWIKFFTRIGASDDLVSGQSTFMVEMNEVSHILKIRYKIKMSCHFKMKLDAVQVRMMV